VANAPCWSPTANNLADTNVRYEGGSDGTMRTVSLLPAATEIVAALGIMDQLVGVSHECNYPESAGDKPRVTACDIAGNRLLSREIDDWVRQRLARGEPLFTLDELALRALRPELILTQRLCDVCAPAYGSVVTLAQTLPDPPRVLNLEPTTLADILQNVELVADAMGVPAAGARVNRSLRERIDRVRRKASAAAHRPRVAVIEWLDPVFCSGHWTPELVEIAGGQEILGLKGQDSVRKTWHDVARAAADILVLACCGQPAARAVQDWEALVRRPEIQALSPVRTGQVYVVDGNAYFSRPGPRVVDTLEILAEIIHPELFAGEFPSRGVRRVGGAPPSEEA
jgi:iron complex transport system substrate-binding protein